MTVLFVDLGLSVDISAADKRASTVASTSNFIILFSFILVVTCSLIPMSFSWTVFAAQYNPSPGMPVVVLPCAFELVLLPPEFNPSIYTVVDTSVVAW